MKQNSLLLYLLTGLLMILNLSCNRNPKLPEHEVPAELLQAPPNFFDRQEEYLEWQAKQLLNLAETALVRFPPQQPEPLERQMAMLMLDAVFHDVEAPNPKLIMTWGESYHYNP